MEDKMLKICREALEEGWTSNKSLSCSYIDCKKCLFGGADNCCDMDTNSFKQLAKDYISKYIKTVGIEYKQEFNWEVFKQGNISVHCNTEEKAIDFLKECDKQGLKWASDTKLTAYNRYCEYEENTCYSFWNGGIGYASLDEDKANGYKIVEWKIKEDEKVGKEIKTKYTYKELIAEWDNINQDDRYIGVGNNYGLTIYKDISGGVAIEYEDGVLGNEVLYIDIEGLFTLQKPLTLDDFEIGEEFKVKDMDGRFMKVKVFDTTMIARKADFGDISVLLYTIANLKDETLIKIKGDK